MQAFCCRAQRPNVYLSLSGQRREWLIYLLMKLPSIHLSLSVICANSLKSRSSTHMGVKTSLQDITTSFSTHLSSSKMLRGRGTCNSVWYTPPHIKWPLNIVFLHFITKKQQNIGNLGKKPHLFRFLLNKLRLFHF